MNIWRKKDDRMLHHQVTCKPMVDVLQPIQPTKGCVVFFCRTGCCLLDLDIRFPEMHPLGFVAPKTA